MSMETVLKQLESKVDELVGAHAAALERAEELARRVAELEGRLSALAEVEERASSMEAQRRELAGRLHRIVATVDRALGVVEGDGAEG